MLSRCLLVSFLFMSVLLSGCAGHFKVKPVSPGATDSGFRYYLPKPYLLLTNMTIVSDTATQAAAKKTDEALATCLKSAQTDEAKAKCKEQNKTQLVADPAGHGTLTAKIIYLPDLGTPYAISTSGAGIGTFKGSFSLSDGWMLTTVNQESDAKIAETITAVATLASKLTPLGFASEGVQESTPPTPYFLLFEIDTAHHQFVQVGDLSDTLKRLLSGSKP